MQDLRALFESEYPGKERLFETLIKPIFQKANDTFLTDEQVLADSDRKQIKSCSIIAQVRGGFPIVFADVELQDTVALKRSRVNIQNCVRRVMENDSNAIIFFHFTDNAKEWRVSYVHRAGTNKNSTSAKRYTYLCGPEHACRTVSERFETLRGLSTIKDEDMIEAFSVEPLSKDFFDEYREHYADLVEYISGKRFVKKGGKFVEEKTKRADGAFKNAFDGDDKAVRDFVKKMMGRLVFLQFLQKKGWLGVRTGDAWGSGDKNFLYNLFSNADEKIQNDFLEQALKPLFFKTLNSDRGDEETAPKKLCDTYGSSIRIPYLNGGLFEEDELDKKNVTFKKEQFKSLFECFNQYNFTIDETDPDDMEIGVDPEMLGKIFENLLEDNKDKGAFYTPKEIVQYMCRESLIEYLSEKIPAEERIRNFVLTHEQSFTDKEKADVLNALLDVKVCDPAVGSGAFPMGMLNELLACTQALIGESKSRAELKKHIVKNNIYGVDIEKGAVDIARLRFWLAIIVDEEEPLPLPNLDYKIMQGNSLLESYTYKIGEGKDKEVTFDLSRMLEKPEDGNFDYTEETRNLLKTNIDEYFGDNNHEDKCVKNDVIKSCVFDLVCATCGLKQNSETALALHEKIWNGTSDFFLWHTWFNDVFNRPQKQGGTKSGFDIVIGNPPYIRRTSISKNDKKQYEKKYESATKQYDLYLLFIEMGMKQLSEKGHLCFINPIRFFNSDYGFGCRKFLVKNHKIRSVLDISQLPVFQNAMTYPCVMLLQQGYDSSNGIFYRQLSDLKEIQEVGRICPIITSQKEIELDSEHRFIIYVDTSLRNLIKKIDSKCHLLSEYFDIARGLANNKVNLDGSRYEALKSTNVRKYFIAGKLNYIDTDFAKVFKEEMIVLPRTVAYLQGMLKEKKIICLDRIYYLSPTTSVDLKFILGVINAKLTNFWFECYYKTTKVQGNYFDLNGNQIGSIPIPPVTAEQQKPIIALVDKILATKKANPNASTDALEAQVDNLVYKLYSLTDEEIAIVEGK